MDGTLSSSKRARVITAESSPNFLSLSLTLLSLEQLLYLREEIPKQIDRHLRGRLPPSSDDSESPEPVVDSSEWIDITDLTPSDLGNDHKLSVLYSQRHQQFPPGHFGFPVTRVKGQNRKCSINELKRFPQLRYSVKHDAVYCLVCFITSCRRLQKENFTDVQFVTKGFQYWPDLGRRFQSHLDASQKRNSNLHCLNAETMINLEKKWKGAPSVHQQANKDHGNRVQRNKYVLTRIIHLLLTLARQGLPFRSKLEERSNFIVFFQLAAMYDPILKDHLEENSSGTRKKYTSHRIQDEFLILIGAVILSTVLTNIKASPTWSVIADEGTDSGDLTQMPVHILYWVMEEKNGKEVYSTKTAFTGFLQPKDTSGEGLFKVLVPFLRDTLGLDMTKLRGQGYDGGGNMSGCKKGLQARMRKEFPLCSYVHCLAHCLNLAINSTCSNKLITFFITFMTSLTFAIKASPKRQVYLKKHTNGKQDTFCETRWTQRSSALTGMKENLPGLVDALVELSELPGAQKDVDAGCYLKGIEDFSFIIVLCMLEKSFGVL